MGTWVVHIPVITHRTGVGPGTLGWLLLVLGTAAFLGMQAVGPLTDRFGARSTVPIGGALCSTALILPGLVHSVWTLAAAVAALGLGNGCLDVAMNTHAVHVERAYGRPIMAAFHAIWSLGGVLASLVGAVTIAWGWPIATTFSGIAAVTLVANAVAARSLLPAEPDVLPGGPATTTSAQSTRTPRRIWALAAVALAVMLCEGVAYDWSTTHVRTVLGASAATASLAYGAYATAATPQRRWSRRPERRRSQRRPGRRARLSGTASGTRDDRRTQPFRRPEHQLPVPGYAVRGRGLRRGGRDADHADDTPSSGRSLFRRTVGAENAATS